MADFLGPAHVRDVKQAVDAFFNLHKRTVRCQVADCTRDHRSHGIVTLDHIPGVGFSLLHTQRDLLLLVVELQHDHGNLVATVQQLRGMVHAAGPGHLGDVHQAFNALLELDESSIGHDVDHLAFQSLTHWVARFHTIPGRSSFLLDTQGDPLPLEIDAQDLDLDLLVHLQHL